MPNDHLLGEDSNPCDDTKHHWVDTYYGVECLNCHLFFAYGSEPWVPEEQEDWTFESDT